MHCAGVGRRVSCRNWRCSPEGTKELELEHNSIFTNPFPPAEDIPSPTLHPWHSHCLHVNYQGWPMLRLRESLFKVEPKPNAWKRGSSKRAIEMKRPSQDTNPTSNIGYKYLSIQRNNLKKQFPFLSTNWKGGTSALIMKKIFSFHALLFFYFIFTDSPASPLRLSHTGQPRTTVAAIKKGNFAQLSPLPTPGGTFTRTQLRVSTSCLAHSWFGLSGGDTTI